MPNSRTEFRWLRKPEVVARSGMSYASLWRMSKQGRFPRWHELGARTIAVRSDEFEAWMESRPVSAIPSPRKQRTEQAATADAR